MKKPPIHPFYIFSIGVQFARNRNLFIYQQNPENQNLYKEKSMLNYINCKKEVKWQEKLKEKLSRENPLRKKICETNFSSGI